MTDAFHAAPLAAMTYAEAAERLRRPFVLPHPVRVVLVRHGQTTANAAGLVAGSVDVPLTPEGVEQARTFKCDRHSFDLAVSSAMSRARHTLRLMLEGGGAVCDTLLPADGRLNEIRLGDFELQAKADLAKRRGRPITLGDVPPNGESYAALTRRVLPFLLALADRAVSAGATSILVVSHQGTMRVLTGILGETTAQHVIDAVFGNVRPVETEWRRLAFPAFLEEE